MNVIKASEEDFATHKSIILSEHPQAMARALSTSIEQAQVAVENEFTTNLPEGSETPGHFFYVVHHEDKVIGYLWLGIKNNFLYLYDIYIYENSRSQGFGTQLIDWIKNKALESKCSALWLHVFGENTRAIDFYRRCGFGATNVSMRMDIGGNEDT